MDEIDAYFRKKLEKGGANVLETFDNMDGSLSVGSNCSQAFRRRNQSIDAENPFAPQDKISQF